uniref:Si:ch211-107n13.1 n=1 Tax=Salarias fasciatus TaxID=181472 RepID=A0A672HRC8_SALFA
APNKSLDLESPGKPPLTPIGSPSPLRLLNKGPDYLRRQIDGGGQGRSISAVERLEADKAKYVKSQQVINTKQEPVLVPCATPPPPPRRTIAIAGSLTPDSLLIYRQKKECKSPNGATVGENNNLELKGYSFVRRLFQGSMREKSGGGEGRIQKMVIGEEKAPSRDGESRMSWTNDKDITDGGAGSRRSSKTDQERSPESDAHSSDHDDENDPWKRASPPAPRRQPGQLQRSKSDLRLRCSVALSEQEHFFDFCGLDMDMIERLGRDNFLSGASSIDTLSLALRSVGGDGCGGSEPSEFSRHSGDGLFQEELTEQLPTGVSIIERNARVIKWLYGCKNAAREGPKESTV